MQIIKVRNKEFLANMMACKGTRQRPKTKKNIKIGKHFTIHLDVKVNRRGKK